MCPAVPTMMERIKEIAEGRGQSDELRTNCLSFITQHSALSTVLFYQLKVAPLRHCLMLGVGEGIGDDDLEDVFAGREVCAEQEAARHADAPQIDLRGRHCELSGRRVE